MNTIRAAVGGLTPFACAALVAVVAAPASAAGLSLSELEMHRFDSPKMQEARRLHQAASSREAGAVLDTTPPKVQAFSISPSVNVSRVPSGVTVTMTATDDDSGVALAFAVLQGPSGQLVQLQMDPGMPLRMANVKAIHTLSPYSEPGVWKVASLVMEDYAGNWISIANADLAALGNTQVTVSSSLPGDVVPANLLGGGTLVNTTVSSGGTQRHTTQPQWVGMTIRAQDAAVAASGVAEAFAWFCTLDRVSCFAFGTLNDIPGTGQPVSMRLFDSYLSGMPPAEYHLQAVYLYDRAGNASNFISTEFGGTTDFSTLFDKTIVTITP